MIIRITIFSFLIFFCGCDITTLRYISVYRSADNISVSNEQINDDDRESFVNLISRTADKHNLIKAEIAQDAEPTIVSDNKLFEGYFKVFSGFYTKDVSLTKGYLWLAVYEYDNGFLIEITTFGGFECARIAENISNDLYGILLKEYNSSQVTKWSGSDYPKGLFLK